MSSISRAGAANPLERLAATGSASLVRQAHRRGQRDSLGKRIPSVAGADLPARVPQLAAQQRVAFIKVQWTGGERQSFDCAVIEGRRREAPTACDPIQTKHARPRRLRPGRTVMGAPVHEKMKWT